MDRPTFLARELPLLERLEDLAPSASEERGGMNDGNRLDPFPLQLPQLDPWPLDLGDESLNELGSDGIRMRGY